MAFETSLPALHNPSHGQVFYVSPSGNDTTGDGSSGLPWATLQKAVDSGFGSTPSNKTIRLRNGSYGTAGTTIHSVANKDASSVAACWCIEADVGHTATIRSELRVDNCSNGTVRSGPGTLKIQGPKTGDRFNNLARIYNTGTNIQFYELEIYEAGDSNGALYVSVGDSAANILVERCYVHHNGLTPGSDTTSQNIYWNNGQGFLIDCILTHGGHSGLQWYSSNLNDTLYIVGCLAYRNNDGFHFNSGGANSHAFLYNCISIGNQGTRGYGVSTGGSVAYTLEMKNCCINGNETNFSFGGVTPVQANNITSDPNLVDPANADFHETVSSPTRGQGAWDIFTRALDFDGVARSNPPDIGPYHFSTGGGGPVTEGTSVRRNDSRMP